MTSRRAHGNGARAQVSTEIMAAVVILLLIFVVVLLFTEQIKQNSSRVQQNVQEEEVCTKLSTIITYMSSNPPYTETLFDLLLDTNVVNGRLFVGDTFCSFLGTAQNVQLYPGIVKAFDINGTVVFTNDLNYTPLLPGGGTPGSNSNSSEGLILLIDDQGTTWYDEVRADDVSYAVSPDDANVDPDWVEFRFANLGLTSANIISSVTVLTKHFESNHIGLTRENTMVQCFDGTTWRDINSYTPSFTEATFVSHDLSWCITDWNAANNARIRMLYEPSGVGSTISIDYGRIDLNFTQAGSLVDLWELQSDLPQPLDFRTDINSTANTFGPGAGNDGWDWSRNAYGGSLNATAFGVDPNYDGNTSDSNVSITKRIEIKLGGGVAGAPMDPDDNSITGMAASGAYGVQFDINAEQYALIQSGSQLIMSFTYFVDADASWGNSVDAGEEGWVKARFGNAGLMTYLGSDLDSGDADADPTNEVWYSAHPTDTSGFFTQDVASLVTGAGTYYLDVGGGLSDWDLPNEGMGIYIDNINLVVI